MTRGTEESTLRVSDIAEGGAGSSPDGMKAFGNRLLFVASDSFAQNRLWGLSLVPDPPVNPGTSSETPTSISWTWQDASFDESGFLVYVDLGTEAPVTIRGMGGANTNSWVSTGLSANNQYAFQVSAVNGSWESAKTDLYTAWTRANTPVAPVVNGPTMTTVNVAIGVGDGNSVYTTYAIYSEITEQWVQEDGSLGVDQKFLTAAEWGSKTVTGLSPVEILLCAQDMNGIGYRTDNGPHGWTRTLANAEEGEMPAREKSW